jgi:hypothetical protein
MMTRFHRIPFQTGVPFSGTRRNDDLRGVACVEYFTVVHRTHQLVQSQPIKLIASKSGALRASLSAPPILPLAETVQHGVV